MKKLSILLALLLMLTVGCEAGSSTTATEDKNNLKEQTGQTEQGLKDIIPFKDRKFIYENGIDIKHEEINERDENMVNLRYSYPAISGLKNKEVQDKINNEMQVVGKALLAELEAKFLSAENTKKLKINQKNLNIYISYNYNNVIFVDYSANIDFPHREGENFQRYTELCYGYDLNTGERITLEDVFKPDSDYKTKLNNFVCQFIIENNYDDFDSNWMTKPFQGIRDNQRFMLNTDNLIILLDEKNDEFLYHGYPQFVFIPLKAIQEELYIFDKYFDEGNCIYEKDKLTKKLLQNEIEFKGTELIQEESKEYYINITKGEFINVPDKEIEKKLNEMAQCSFDIEDFKKKAKETAAIGKMSHYSFHVKLLLNEGGYISVIRAENIILEGQTKTEIIPFNYDFNLNKELHLKDMYTDLEGLKEDMKRQIEIIRIPIPEEMVDSSIEKAIQADKFYFDEYAVVVYFSPEDVELEDYNQWIWIPFNELNKEKIKLLQ